MIGQVLAGLAAVFLAWVFGTGYGVAFLRDTEGVGWLEAFGRSGRTAAFGLFWLLGGFFTIFVIIGLIAVAIGAV